MYYVMTCEGLGQSASVRKISDVPGGPWLSGHPIRVRVPNPVVFSTVAGYPGEPRPMYQRDFLLMRDDLIAALHYSGVDNLELFAAVIRDRRKKKEPKDYSNYKAVNIVGVVSAADMEKSTMMGTSDSTLIDADFDGLQLDESKTGGALLFRLAESVGAIVVHEKVRKVVEEAGIPGMTFYGPGEWSG